MADWNPRANEIFVRSLDLTDADRAAFLTAECADDSSLLRSVEALLRAHMQAGGFLTDPHPDALATGTFGDGKATRTAGDETRAGEPGGGTPVGHSGGLIAGRYKLLERIGEGGMGTVWMAEQTEPVTRKVAVKLIRAEKGSSATILARFAAERQAIALMDHPHIAKLLDAGTTETGSPFFVMELVKGVPLTDYCDAHRLSVPDRLALFQQICSAVQHAHQKGVIHRDLKPGNILVESHDGKPMPKVIDFGLAKATSGMPLTENTLFTGFGNVMGTPLYMAPEQASFNAVDVDTRADVYALGVILYELLTGTTPLTRDSIRKAALDEMLRLVREQEAPAPSSRLSSSESKPTIAINRQAEPAKLSRFVRGELDWIALKALSKDRDRRYESATALAADVGRFLNHEPVSAGPPSRMYRLRKFVRRNRPQVAAAGLVLLALVAGVIGTTLGLLEARDQTEIAKEETAEKEKARANEATQRGIAEGNERTANDERAKAVAAAEKEKLAKEEAIRNLAFAEKGNEILGAVFAGLDPKKIAESGRPLQDMLRENLVNAIKELDEAAIKDPLVLARMQAKLGLSLIGLGEGKLAVEVLGKARAGFEAKFGPAHLLTLRITNNLAVSYSDADQLDKARSLLEETLQISKVKFGLNHPDSLNCLNNLSAVYHKAGQFDKALPLIEEAYKLTKDDLGPDHPDTLRCMHNLAQGYHDAGQRSKSLSLLKEVYELMKAKLGSDHPYTLMCMGNLAGSYHDAGQRDKALSLRQNAYELMKARLGPDHPYTLLCLRRFAREHQDVGRSDLALPLLEDCYKLTEAKLGRGHPDTLSILANLARVYWGVGRLNESVPLFEKLLPFHEKEFGRDHPVTQESVANLGVNYKDAGRVAEALPLLEEAYRSSKKYPALRWVGQQLLDAYASSAKPTEVRRLIRELLPDARKALPGGSQELAGILAQFGRELLEIRDFAEAESLLREALAIREKTQSNVWTTFNTQSILGGALLGQKKYAEAEPLLVKGYEGMKAREKGIPPQSSTRIPESLDRLISLYTATKKPDAVKKYRELRAAYPPELAPSPKPVK